VNEATSQDGVKLIIEAKGGVGEAERRFALEVLRLNKRYASEVVAAFRLCPHLREVDSGLGVFCIILDREPEIARAVELLKQAESTVVHLVFPRAEGEAEFRRFATALGEEVSRAFRPKAPVYAVFHPELAGDASTPHRLVGLLRHGPDPMIQFIPSGLSQGGTVFVTSAADLVEDNAHQNFSRLKGEVLSKLEAALADIHADRARSYPPLLQALP
jgi:hypothetical protein